MAGKCLVVKNEKNNIVMSLDYDVIRMSYDIIIMSSISHVSTSFGIIILAIMS